MTTAHSTSGMPAFPRPNPPAELERQWAEFLDTELDDFFNVSHMYTAPNGLEMSHVPLTPCFGTREEAARELKRLRDEYPDAYIMFWRGEG